ncbi:MAG: hypothetical protein IJJ82_00720 [Clostridia bacterium]|nr:hypothetical protein [Clostridia bacterium]
MERKVRIISISGQPLSGKSTAIDKMTELLKEQGIKDEDIHVVSVGKMFREYFNKIMDLSSALKNKSKEELKQIPVDDELKQLCSNKLLRNKMKQALVNLLTSEFDISSFDIEKANNSLELKEIRDLIDTIVDTRVAELGKEAIKNNRENEVWIMDSRLAFSNIPESFAVRLTVRDDIAGERLFAGTRKRGKEDNNYADVKEAMEKTIKRGQGEEKRYKERYGIELSNEDNYNLIIDTSFSNVDDIANTILQCEELERHGKSYGKRWTSPKMLIPMQGELDTLRPGFGSGLNIDEIRELIKENGYEPDSEIFVFEYNGRLYIKEGHHRNFAAAQLGYTLVPYEKDEEMEENKKEQWANCLSIAKLTGHEQFFDTKNPDGSTNMFSYNYVFPGIYNEIRERTKNRGR